MSEKILKIEHTLMELGVEVFRLRSQLNSIIDEHKKLVDSLKGLQSILDEKDLISKEDFELAVSVLSLSAPRSNLGSFSDAEEDRLHLQKKNSH